jgi:hypothetical protein
MKPGIKKIAPGKTKRVATVFTGAAACAAAFVPAAHAANGHQAGLDGKKLTLAQHYGTMHGARPDDYPASGSIEAGTCATTPRWVHVVDGIHHSCFGFHGTWKFSISGSPAFVDVSQICGGTNHGWYKSAGGRTGYYGPGKTYVHLPVTTMKSIHISGWSKGNTACPAP